MKTFSQSQVEEAKAYALEGGQALHLHRIIVDRDKAPACFVQAVDRGEDIAHLFDQDAKRLRDTVKKLGVRVVVIEHRGTPRQHVDLCGRPLQRAKTLADLNRGKRERG
ncbi:MAG TPA: hypothetical protein VFE62_20895 [Gemmataceae bacterium]|nr:hypothetical protein [Gemmataceae bacterium]